MKTCSLCGELITEEFDLDAFLDWWKKLIDEPTVPLPSVALAHRCTPTERMPVAPIQVKDALARRHDMKDRLARFKAHIGNICKDYKIKVQYRFNCGSAPLEDGGFVSRPLWMMLPTRSPCTSLGIAFACCTRDT